MLLQLELKSLEAQYVAAAKEAEIRAAAYAGQQERLTALHSQQQHWKEKAANAHDQVMLLQMPLLKVSAMP